MLIEEQQELQQEEQQENQNCIQYQATDTIISKQVNLTYVKDNKEFKFITPEHIRIIDPINVNSTDIYFNGYVFSSSCSSCKNIKSDFYKITHTVSDNVLSNISNVLKCTANLNDRSVEISGPIEELTFNFYHRQRGWFSSLGDMFSNSYIAAYKSKDSPYTFYQGIKSKHDDLILFLPKISFDNLQIVQLSSKNSNYNVFSYQNKKFENIYIGYKTNTANNVSFRYHTIPYRFQDVMDAYGYDVAIKIFGYSTYVLNSMHKYINNYVHNDSTSALFSILLLMLATQNIPYLLFLLLKLLKFLFKIKNKHINDNQDKIGYFTLMLIKNWNYVWNIYAIISIYGITCTKNIIQFLQIKDGFYLNNGYSIIDMDNTFVMLKTRVGYLSIFKLILILAIVGKQIIAYIHDLYHDLYTKTATNTQSKSFGMILMLTAIVYSFNYTYSTTLIIILTNITVFTGSVLIILINWCSAKHVDKK
jgi:hypothetical protein